MFEPFFFAHEDTHLRSNADSNSVAKMHSIFMYEFEFVPTAALMTLPKKKKDKGDKDGHDHEEKEAKLPMAALTFISPLLDKNYDLGPLTYVEDKSKSEWGHWTMARSARLFPFILDAEHVQRSHMTVAVSDRNNTSVFGKDKESKEDAGESQIKGHILGFSVIALKGATDKTKNSFSVPVSNGGVELGTLSGKFIAQYPK